MKILITEKQSRILNEVKGVSETSIAYVNFLYGLIEPRVIEMLAVMEDDLDEFYVDVNEILKNLKGNKEVFLDLPVEEFEIDLKFKVSKKIPENELSFDRRI